MDRQASSSLLDLLQWQYPVRLETGSLTAYSETDMANRCSGRISAEPGAALKQSVHSEVHHWPVAPVAAECFYRIVQGSDPVAVCSERVAARSGRIVERLGRWSVP